MIYLDWAATAIPNEDIIVNACKKALHLFANPSSKHGPGLRARAALEKARQDAAACLGVKPESLFFTSGGTEADHIPLLSVMALNKPCSVAISTLEHAAVAEQAKIMERRGFKILKIPADRAGFISPEAVIGALQEDTALVSVMAVNNEIGSVQPIDEIGAALEEYSKGKRRIHFHTDAVQAIGKIPFNLAALRIHSAAFSGHKIGAMRGTGLLYLNRNLESFIRGGGHEGGIRPGTENLAGILSLAESLKSYYADLEENLKQAAVLNGLLIEELQKIKGAEIVPKERLKNPAAYSPWIVQFACKNLPGEVLVRCLSERDICISTGSACSAKKNTRPVLEAIGIQPAMQLSAVRVSIGRTTTAEEIKEFAAALQAVLTEF